MQWEKCRYLTGIEKVLTQYFHSKHLKKNDLSVMKKHFFQWNCVFRAKKIFSKIYWELLLHANLTKLIGSLYSTPQVLVFIHLKIFSRSKSFKHCMFKLTLQIGLYKKISNKGAKRNKKMGDRSYVITFGVFLLKMGYSTAQPLLFHE